MRSFVHTSSINLDSFIYSSVVARTVDDGKDSDYPAFYAVDSAIVTHSQTPAPFEGPTKWFAKKLRLRKEPAFNNVAYLISPKGIELSQLVNRELVENYRVRLFAAFFSIVRHASSKGIQRPLWFFKRSSAILLK